MHVQLQRLRRLLLAGALVAVAVALWAPANGRARPATARSKPAGTPRQSPDPACPWLDESLPVAQRVSMLLSHMTLSEKIAEMEVPGTENGSALSYHGLTAAQPALCIPALPEQDGSLGIGDGATGVTQFPAEISLASAWDPSLARSYGTAVGDEARAKGIGMILGPGVNIQRDPRWGRNFEMFSEDPLLTSVLGDQWIEGLQSQGVMADVKHLVAYNEELGRYVDQNAIVGERALQEIYLPPFYAAATSAKAASIMCSYAMLNGVYSCQDRALLTTLVDDRWDYQGFIRSDYASSHSGIGSANAGLDQERGSDYWGNGALAGDVYQGLVKSSVITDAVRRILTQMFDLNMFNDPPTGTFTSPASTPQDVGLSQTVAQEGSVLLRNVSHALPLSPATTHSIAVIGADGTTNPLAAGGGSSHVLAPYVVSPLSAITSAAGPGTAVSTYAGSDPTQAAQAAAGAQTAIVFASQRESEGSDLNGLSLPGEQNALISAVAAANPDTIVVLNTGGPVLMPWLHQVRGVLEAWYPGQQDGAAVASVLFGDTDPGGHLPETFPVRVSQLPTAVLQSFPGVDGQVRYTEGLDVGYRGYEALHERPLFPFGFGLSYTNFRFSDLTLSRTTFDNPVSGPDNLTGQAARLFTVHARITNTGSVAGSDVAQLYLGDPASATEPSRQLEGFKRVSLAPGQSTVVSFAVTGHEMSYFSNTADGWTLPRGRFTAYVGDSSALASLPLRGHVTVTQTLGSRRALLLAPSTVNPGSTFDVTVKFINPGDFPIVDAHARLQAPGGWTVTALHRRVFSLGPGRTAVRRYRVSVPVPAQTGSGTLTASLTSPAPDLAGDVSDFKIVDVAPGVTLAPPAALTLAPGETGSVTLAATSHLPSAATFAVAPTAPTGITATATVPSVTVGAGASTGLAVSVAAAATTAPGTYLVAVNPSFMYDGLTHGLPAQVLKIVVGAPAPAPAP